MDVNKPRYALQCRSGDFRRLNDGYLVELKMNKVSPAKQGMVLLMWSRLSLKKFSRSVVPAWAQRILERLRFSGARERDGVGRKRRRKSEDRSREKSRKTRR